MYRATTPNHTYTLPVDTATCSIIRVTYEQLDKKLRKTYRNGIADDGMVLDGNDVIITLTQSETNTFKPGRLSSQVRVLTVDNASFQSDVFPIIVKDVLDDEVLE